MNGKWLLCLNRKISSYGLARTQTTDEIIRCCLVSYDTPLVHSSRDNRFREVGWGIWSDWRTFQLFNRNSCSRFDFCNVGAPEEVAGRNDAKKTDWMRSTSFEGTGYNRDTLPKILFLFSSMWMSIYEDIIMW